MDFLELLGTALGLGVAAGLSLYGTAFVLGLAIRLEWLALTPDRAPLAVLADPLILLIAGVLFFFEFFADKIPWVDSAWDALHTVIRPVGGALLAARALGELHPAALTVAFLFLGGVTLATHAAKASARLVVNASPEPVSNLALSTTENALVLGLVWLAVTHPYVTLAVAVLGVGGAVALIVWLGGRALAGLRARRARTRARRAAGESAS